MTRKMKLVVVNQSLDSWNIVLCVWLILAASDTSEPKYQKNNTIQVTPCQQGKKQIAKHNRHSANSTKTITHVAQSNLAVEFQVMFFLSLVANSPIHDVNCRFSTFRITSCVNDHSKKFHVKSAPIYFMWGCVEWCRKYNTTNQQETKGWFNIQHRKNKHYIYSGLESLATLHIFIAFNLLWLALFCCTRKT